MLHVQLQKAVVGGTWSCCTVGPHAQLSGLEREREQERLLLERFQREHTGFDFSQATVSGQAPAAEEFMGGVKRSSR